MIGQVLLRLAWHTGALGAFHRWRNRNALTVLGLHRVLPEEDPRWAGADPLYTVTPRFLEQCLDVLVRHYHVVSLEAVEAARRGGTLPARPLLITFDDGWADNYEYALPVLRRYGVPAVLFCASDVIGRREGFFQERLIAAWRLRKLKESQVRELWKRTGASGDAPAGEASESQIRHLIAGLQRLDPPVREEILRPLADVLADAHRHMIDGQQLAAMVRGGVALGAHGRQHEPLTAVHDLDTELQTARREIARAGDLSEDSVATLSFPFSRFDRRVVERARALGYRVLFGGGGSLTPVGGSLPDLIARVGVTAGGLADEAGNLRPELLASYLFRRPHAALVVR